MQKETFVTCPKCKSTVTTFWGSCRKCGAALPGYEHLIPPGPDIMHVSPPADDPYKLKAENIKKVIEDSYVEVKGENKKLEGSKIASKRKQGDTSIAPLKLNDEQAYALANDSQYCLVSARAGSGKTRTIISKMLYLIDQEGLDPEEVLALSFNKGVRKEINERANESFRSVEEKYAIRGFDFARTFHSLAYRAEAKHRILKDEEKKELIRDLLNCLKLNPFFKQRVYRHFRDESFSLDRKQFSSEANYYKYLRNLTYTTLRGETVKSQGEKWIADFLYEHGVRYEYEKSFYTFYIKPNVLKGTDAEKAKIKTFLDKNCRKTSKGKEFREAVIPDFYLPDYKLILEHWGIDENEKNTKVKESFGHKFGSSWEEYFKKMLWKRTFWNSNLRVFIKPDNVHLKNIVNIKKMLETSIVDSSKGREAFEAHLTSLFTTHGVLLKKVDQQQLEEEVWSHQYPRFVQMMQTFIDKFEQRYPDGDVESIKEKLAEMVLDERQKDFISIGLEVVDHYYDITQHHKYPLFLTNKKKYEEIDCDYNQLMANATKTIYRGDSDALIGKLQVLLIDEYQDFSQLFYEFVSAILQRNPKLKVFCVGDPWQAINRFMGADVRYFENFKTYFPEAKELSITQNYRSGKKIVKASNAFMRDQDFPGKEAGAAASFGGKIIIEDVRNVFIINTPEKNPSYQVDQEIINLFNTDGILDPLISKYIKRLIEIIISEDVVSGSKSFLILSRVGKIRRRYELEEVARKVKTIIHNNYGWDDSKLNNIELNTIHACKGKEADAVILLEANRGRMPLLHPDHDLYQIFDETAETVMQDEARLFYVAITRPKKALYILHDDNPSEYLKSLSKSGLVEWKK